MGIESFCQVGYLIDVSDDVKVSGFDHLIGLLKIAANHASDIPAEQFADSSLVVLWVSSDIPVQLSIIQRVDVVNGPDPVIQRKVLIRSEYGVFLLGEEIHFHSHVQFDLILLLLFEAMELLQVFVHIILSHCPVGREGDWGVRRDAVCVHVVSNRMMNEHFHRGASVTEKTMTMKVGQPIHLIQI